MQKPTLVICGFFDLYSHSNLTNTKKQMQSAEQNVTKDSSILCGSRVKFTMFGISIFKVFGCIQGSCSKAFLGLTKVFSWYWTRRSVSLRARPSLAVPVWDVPVRFHGFGALPSAGAAGRTLPCDEEEMATVSPLGCPDASEWN